MFFQKINTAKGETEGEDFLFVQQGVGMRLVVVVRDGRMAFREIAGYDGELTPPCSRRAKCHSQATGFFNNGNHDEGPFIPLS